jgi:hypothetical protein
MALSLAPLRAERHLKKKELLVPLPVSLPPDESDDIFSCSFAADEAFPLNKFSMGPWPRRVLNNKRHIFNYRLSFVRKYVESTAGALNAKFKI